MAAKAAKKLVKQHTGGMASLSGGVFETHFAIWRVLRALERLLTGEHTRLALQLKNCHVDDWVEDRQNERHFFQLKRKKSLSWSAVRTEFAAQLATKVKGKVVEVSLVVASKAQVQKLRSSKKAVPKARVMFFPPSLYPQEVLTSAPAGATVRAACIKPSPTRSDLEAIWSSIDFAWQKVRKPGNFVGVEVLLGALPDHPFPPLRYPWTPTESWWRAEKLLRRVPLLSFTLDSGHFTYSDGAGTNGRLSCRTSAFRKFVLRVLLKRPKNLDAVWDLL